MGLTILHGMKTTDCVILGGNRSNALYPLTRERSSCGINFAGRYRMADIALSNAVYSGFRNIKILTSQAEPDLGEHLQKAYSFDRFAHGGVQILPHSGAGSADALRNCWDHLVSRSPERICLLFGDELYRMDLRELVRTHEENHHDITLAVRPLGASEALDNSLIKLTSQGLVEQIGHPPFSQGLEEWIIPKDYQFTQQPLERSGFYNPIGAMVFETEILEQLLKTPKANLVKDLLSQNLWDFKSGIYPFGGYWADLGTLKGFYQANLSLCTVHPPFNLYDQAMPLIFPPSFLPPAKINFGTISQVLAEEGVIVNNCTLSNSLLGPRTILETGVVMDGVVFMGADFYEDPLTQSLNKTRGIPHLGVGKGSVLQGCIVDKNVRIGEGCRIGSDPIHRPDQDKGSWFIKDGIIVLPRGTIIASGTII